MDECGCQIDELLERKERFQQQLHNYLVCMSPRHTAATAAAAAHTATEGTEGGQPCSQETIVSDVNVFKQKIEVVEKQLTMLQSDFREVNAAHMNATILYEESVVQKTAFCEQLLAIVSANERHKLHQMKEWISDQKLEESFGEEMK